MKAWDINSLSKNINRLIKVPPALEVPALCFFEKMKICNMLEAPPLVSGSGRYPAVFYGRMPRGPIWKTPWGEKKVRFCVPIVAGGELLSCCEVKELDERSGQLILSCRGVADRRHVNLLNLVATKVFGLRIGLDEEPIYPIGIEGWKELEKKADELFDVIEKDKIIVLNPMDPLIHLKLGPLGYLIYTEELENAVEVLKKKFRWMVPPPKLKRVYIKNALKIFAQSDPFARFAEPLYHKRIAAIIPGYGAESDIRDDETLRKLISKHLTQLQSTIV